LLDRRLTTGRPVKFSEKPVRRNELQAFGGMRVTDGGSNICTSGWTVFDGSQYGVTIAAHCEGADGIRDPKSRVLSFPLLVSDNARVQVISSGPDRQANTDDDIAMPRFSQQDGL
jgi:hypothetical protein